VILATRARYFGPTDAIQVAILVQEDDSTSAAKKVKAGRIEILDHGTTMFSEEFTGRQHVLWFEGDTNYDAAEDRGQFYFFLHHPPVGQNLEARVTVTLADARTATERVPIDYQNDLDSTDWQNPALPNRDPIKFDREAGFPHRGQE